ncbi:Mitochondrial dicarboxylate transporter [Ogataea parapolymorpha DL-1]|uniref:Mitochondrial dicarboxylate transporter n=1 Tax=Ogataea parapolymorpha (strain ATCC 26012 / BCRC 20466 / JCM 22074 / NRRL Y-7560 / DL-1) TaxID=871575 RepID=W1QCX3_OGAPD|nr:Mitochondrial dicarboxylate transporter [Ogataea parapolymorpha DL-1]ESW98389.1 Mitochondrial dicarboxylate transporter [Ogataea parapolymorpha DL-1]
MNSDKSTKSIAPSANFPFWYGGAASMFACLFTHPLDLAKVRLQTAKVPGDSLVSLAFKIIKTEGVLAAYAGLTASLLRQATYSTARFGVYEKLKEIMTDPTRGQASTFQLLAASMIAGAVGGVVGNPADVVNIRMQNDNSLPESQRRHYKHALDGLLKITREENLTALFRGLGPNLARGILMTASQVVSYDVAKKLLVENLSMDPKTKATHFSASLIAGLVATTVCSPADVLKTRIMNSSGTGQSSFGILKDAISREGLGFMFRGWTPAFIRLGPHTILTFIALEELRRLKIGL